MTIVLDAGALIAIDRGERWMMAILKGERDAGRVPLTHGAVVGQVWRGGGRQANLARALAMLDVRPVDAALGRRAGALLGVAGTADVIDAALVLLADHGDEVYTSDAGDLAGLAAAADLHIDIVPT